MPESYLSRKYFDGIYIPAGLLVFGTAICKMDWVLYAALLAVALGVLKFYNMRMLLYLVDMACTRKETNISLLNSPQEGPQARPIPRL